MVEACPFTIVMVVVPETKVCVIATLSAKAMVGKSSVKDAAAAVRAALRGVRTKFPQV